MVLLARPTQAEMRLAISALTIVAEASYPTGEGRSRRTCGGLEEGSMRERPKNTRSRARLACALVATQVVRTRRPGEQESRPRTEPEPRRALVS